MSSSVTSGSELVDQVALWHSAAAAFDARHRQIRPDQQTLPTPCPEFDVEALIEHAVGTQVTIGRMLGGSAADGASWAEARAAMEAVLVLPRALDGDTEHPRMGPTPRKRLAAIATNDLLVHTWDLAHAAGLDDRLPVANLQPAIDGIEAFEPAARSRLFAGPLPVADDGDLQARLLAVAGRAS